MDLLVQVTTASKISPGEHVIQAVGDRGILPYKPSTPIGMFLKYCWLNVTYLSYDKNGFWIISTDLLVQVWILRKVNYKFYKFSYLFYIVGALDIWIIHIVSKKQIGNTYTKKPLPNPTNQSTPFEQTFRLQVRMPKNWYFIGFIFLHRINNTNLKVVTKL